MELVHCQLSTDWKKNLAFEDLVRLDNHWQSHKPTYISPIVNQVKFFWHFVEKC